MKQMNLNLNVPESSKFKFRNKILKIRDRTSRIVNLPTDLKKSAISRKKFSK